MRPSPRALPTLFGLFCCLLAPACSEDGPSPALVEDLRVLAVRAEPPELLVERHELGEATPPQHRQVRFDALVVDPRGTPMVFGWQFCPVESATTCADYDAHKAALDPALAARFVPALEAARAQGQSGAAVVSPEGVVTTGSFEVAIAPSLFAYHLHTSALGLGNGAWASAVLRLETGAETLLAQKRLVLSARDLSAFNPELAHAGFQICPPGGDVPPDCLPLAPRIANRNPEVLGIEVARTAGAEASFAPVSSPLVLSAKEKIRLRPLLAPDAEEAYQSLESALQGSRLQVVEQREELIVSWFATAGTFVDEQTSRQLSKTIDNGFTAPDMDMDLGALPAGKPLAIYLVVRDQRGGVGWARLDVLVQ